MKHTLRIIILSIISIFSMFAHSETNVTKEQWRYADYGKKLDDSRYINHIRLDLRSTLIDPNSLILSCKKARKGWIGFSKPKFGWIVVCDVNAKNRFGGYAGSEPHIYWFKDERVINFTDFAMPGYSFGIMPKSYEW